jgi:type I restriction enzyme S subunit
MKMNKEWTIQPLGDLVRIASGQVDPKDAEIANMLSVGPDNLRTGGGLNTTGVKTASELEQISGKYAFDKNAILYSKIRPNLNKIAIVNFDGICSADMYPIWVRDGAAAVRDFIYYVMNSERFVADATSRSFRTGLPKINRPDLESIEVRLPPLPEQRKIAEILRTWDEAIEKLTALRTAKEKRLHSLREKLTYFDAQGEPVRLGDVSEEVTKRNGGGLLGREMVMGVTNSRGIVPMREQTIAEDISRYKVVPPQAFAYNPMRINVGSIAMNEAEEPILVSPDYVVFACLQGRLSPDFLDHLRNTKWWSHYINSGGSGSVRQRTYYADLAAMKVPLPNFERQCRIADVLNTGRRDVEMTTIEIDALTRQKRGLMQKLLTGEWRVTVDPTTPFNPAEETHDGR